MSSEKTYKSRSIFELEIGSLVPVFAKGEKESFLEWGRYCQRLPEGTEKPDNNWEARKFCYRAHPYAAYYMQDEHWVISNLEIEWSEPRLRSNDLFGSLFRRANGSITPWCSPCWKSTLTSFPRHVLRIQAFTTLPDRRYPLFLFRNKRSRFTNSDHLGEAVSSFRDISPTFPGATFIDVTYAVEDHEIVEFLGFA